MAHFKTSESQTFQPTKASVVAGTTQGMSTSDQELQLSIKSSLEFNQDLTMILSLSNTTSIIYQIENPSPATSMLSLEDQTLLTESLSNSGWELEL